MATTFPISLDQMLNPHSAASMQEISHSSQHINANDAIEAIQLKLGIDASQDVNSISYKVADLISKIYTNAMAQDAIRDSLQSGTHVGITFNYNDNNNSLSLTATYDDAEVISAIATALTAGTGITKTVTTTPPNYLGDYNNGAYYNINDVISIPVGSPYGIVGSYFIRTGNPGNPGYPPEPGGATNASWTLYTFAQTITLSVDTASIATKEYVDTAVNSLSNTSASTYVPISLLAAQNGVATLNADSVIPDNQISSSIARDTEVSSAIATAAADATTKANAAQAAAALDATAKANAAQAAAALDATAKADAAESDAIQSAALDATTKANAAAAAAINDAAADATTKSNAAQAAAISVAAADATTKANAAQSAASTDATTKATAAQANAAVDATAKANAAQAAAAADATAKANAAQAAAAADATTKANAAQAAAETTAANTYLTLAETDERIQDVAGGMVSGNTEPTGFSTTYDDTTGKLNFDITTADLPLFTEAAQDAAGALFAHSGHTNVTAVYDDVANQVNLSVVAQLTQEQAQDYIAPLFVHGLNPNITATYDDTANKLILETIIPPSKAIMSSSAPSNPIDGAFWFDTDEFRSGTTKSLKVWSASSQTWEYVSTDLSLSSNNTWTSKNTFTNGVIVGLDLAPLNPVQGQIYYNKPQAKLKVWEADLWQDIQVGGGGGGGLQLMPTDSSAPATTFFVGLVAPPLGATENGDLWIDVDDTDTPFNQFYTGAVSPDPQQYEFWVDNVEPTQEIIYSADEPAPASYTGELWIDTDEFDGSIVEFGAEPPNPDNVQLWVDINDNETPSYYKDLTFTNYATIANFPSNAPNGYIAADAASGLAYVRSQGQWLSIVTAANINTIISSNSTVFEDLKALAWMGFE